MVEIREDDFRLTLQSEDYYYLIIAIVFGTTFASYSFNYLLKLLRLQNEILPKNYKS